MEGTVILASPACPLVCETAKATSLSPACSRRKFSGRQLRAKKLCCAAVPPPSRPTPWSASEKQAWRTLDLKLSRGPTRTRW